MNPKRSKHDKELTALIQKAIRTNLKGVKALSMDNRFYDHPNLRCAPDGLAFASGELYILEYKCTDSPHSRRRARQQLETAEDFVLNEMGILVPIHKIYCYEKTHFEEI